MKGQTAMEYLMTYGWAILIVIVVVAALYSMGVFTLKGGVACSPCFGYFSFIDYTQGSGAGATGRLIVRDGPKTIHTISAVSVPNGAATVTDCGDATTPPNCESGDDIEVGTIPNDIGNIEVTITYTDMDSTLVHTDTATLHNK